jgi:hypothetical protein
LISTAQGSQKSFGFDGTKEITMPDDTKFLKRLQNAAEALARLERGEAPGAEDLAVAPLLEGWHLTEHHHFLALGGVVTGHPSLPDGAHILTSPLLWIADDQGSARTISRFYRLGTSLEDLLTTKD